LNKKEEDMFARVAVIEAKPERVEDGILDYRDQVIPAARKMAGFKATYLLVDRRSGKNLSITLWDTEKDLQASAAAANQLRAKASQTLASMKPPIVEMYEVAVHS
jgi:heme-degrading monooxygenase HmoA